MPAQNLQHLLRLTVGIVAVLTLLVYFSPDAVPALASMATTSGSSGGPSADPIPQLAVTLAPVPGADPPALRATITNNNPFPVSFLDYDSPVDELAVPLGLVELTPAEGGSPVALDGRLLANRPWPPRADFVVEVPAGGGTVVSGDIALRPADVPYGKLGDAFSVRMKGPWRAVFAMPRSQVTDELLEHIPEGARTYQGTFESDRIVMNVDSAKLDLK
ncbi:hypothetical protein V2A60_006460 [Cordyceps javanica]|uniref:Uncharacterized protein n=1 Tax=Cordyceps javanica TaxID=43265 RepID=A0A545W507_9HYPO|nr:hypothetical protein IF1G_03560 [Cordyceps javanica]TQW09008.1 hypothetical protein IF2G_03439 [Cordyceps javanica]